MLFEAICFSYQIRSRKDETSNDCRIAGASRHDKQDSVLALCNDLYCGVNGIGLVVAGRFIAQVPEQTPASRGDGQSSGIGELIQFPAQSHVLKFAVIAEVGSQKEAGF